MVGGFGTSFVLGWMGSGQAFAHLGTFLANGLAVVRSYNGALGWEGLDLLRTIGLVLAPAVLAMIILRTLPAFGSGEKRRAGCRLLVLAWLSLLTFTVWKYGCVRSGREMVFLGFIAVLALALEAAEIAGAGPLKVKIGDAKLFDSALSALRLPDVWLRRIRRGLSRGRALETILANGGGQGALSQSGVLAALESADHAGAKALVEDLLAIAGIATVGGRSAGEIADRFLEQAAQRSQSHVGNEQQEAIRRFLAIVGDPDSASRQLRALADEAKLDLGAALDSFDQRVGFLAARGLPIETFSYSAGFVRDLDYYTGFVFEAVDAADPTARPAVGGGRYDGLARRLGAAADVPAIGAAVWIERLPAREARK